MVASSILRAARHLLEVLPIRIVEHRLDDILEPLGPEIVAGEFDLAADLPKGIIGKAETARLREPLQACCDVDAVAENIVVFDNDIADMETDAEFNPGLRQLAAVMRGHGALDVHGASRCIDRACELRQHAVADRLDDTAMETRDHWRHQRDDHGVDAELGSIVLR